MVAQKVKHRIKKKKANKQQQQQKQLGNSSPKYIPKITENPYTNTCTPIFIIPWFLVTRRSNNPNFHHG